MTQQIVVHTVAASHENVVMAAAVASCEAYHKTSGHNAWNSWLYGPFVKTVRRCKNVATFTNLSERFAASMIQVGGAFAFAMIPCYKEDLPEEVAKTQVAGFERDRTGLWGNNPRPSLFQIAINPTVEMSTGKTAAQVAHAMFRLSQQYGFSSIAEHVEVHDTSDWFDKILTFKSHDSIHDAGATEVARGTETVRYGVLSS